LEEKALRFTLAERAKDLLHSLHAFELKSYAVDAAKAHVIEIMVQPIYLPLCAPDVNVDVSRHVLGLAAQVRLLPREPNLKGGEVIAETPQSLERFVNLSDLSGDPVA